MRAPCLGRILFAAARKHFAIIAGKFAYRLGKIIPAHSPFIRKMVNCPAFNARSVDDMHQGSGKVGCTGRAAHLVINHAHLLAAAHNVAHGLHEVFAIRGIQPGCAHNDAAASGFEEGLLPWYCHILP